jgi:uridylate kinase
MKTLVISLGGSLIAPGNIDVEFLKRFRKVIIAYIKKTGDRVVLISGGGNTCRHYQLSAKQVNKGVTKLDLDWIGIATTRLNAELVRSLFGRFAHQKQLINPAQKIITNAKILVGAGYAPGHSSDNDAVLAAKAFGAKTVINLSNIDRVYDSDPNKNKNAKPFDTMTWKEFRGLVGGKWVPGAHVPFDPVACGNAEKLGMELVIMKGSDVGNFQKYLSGKKFVGTRIG